jgi:hypothetical protein
VLAVAVAILVSKKRRVTRGLWKTSQPGSKGCRAWSRRAPGSVPLVELSVVVVLVVVVVVVVTVVVVVVVVNNLTSSI